MNSEKGRKKLITAVWSLAISLLVLIFIVYALLFISKGWMSNKRSVTGNSNGVNIKKVANLEVRKTSGGEDIDSIRAKSDNDTDDDLVLNFDGDKLRPGSHGSFTAYIVNDPSTVQSKYTININLYAQAELDNEQNPYFNNLTDEEKKKILQSSVDYVNTHVAFFCSYNEETNEYKDWIPCNEQYNYPTEFKENSDSPDKEFPVTIYWVWIEYYSDVGDNGSGPSFDRTYLINQADRVNIYQKMSLYPDSWFYGTYSNRNVGYNYADMYLANNLKFTNFEMEITPIE